MSAARRAARVGRNLLIALLVGAVIIVAIVVAYVAGRSSGTSTAGPSDVPTTTVTATATGATPQADAAPTGCLGGQDRTNGMLLAAQKTAPNSTYGAVEVATAFFRWTYRYPEPSAGDIKAIGDLFVPGNEATSESSLADDYARNANPSGGTVKDGTPFYLSTVAGKWIAQPGSSASDQLISIQAPFVINGALSATKSTTEAFTMRWVEGAWRIVGVAKSDPTKIAAGGTTFTAGC